MVEQNYFSTQRTIESPKARSIAQGTIEYLVIIAIVVVISLVVVALLLNISETDSTQILSNKNQNIIGKSGISVIDSVISSTGDGVLSIQNNSGENLTLKRITPGASGISCDKLLSPGEKYNCYLKDVNSVCPCSAGQRVTCDFVINFETKNGLTKTETFTIINDCTDQEITNPNPPSNNPDIPDTPSQNYNLTINVYPTNSGIVSTGGNYAATETIQINAEPNQGYIFTNWTTNSNGTFEDSENPTTNFMMPNNDVIITANMEKITIELIPNARINSVSYDEEGNTFIAGSFSGTIILGNITLTSFGGTDIFIAKLSPTNEWQWAKQAGGTKNDQGGSIEIDSSGDIIITGKYESNANFGPINVSSSTERYDLFVAKISSSGEWQWANNGQVQYTANVPSGNDKIYIDQSGNAFVIGQFCGGAEFGGNTLSSQIPSLYDIFVAKISSSGEWQWAKQSTINNNGYHLSLNDYKYDQSGNAFLTGSFCGGISFADQDLYTSNAVYGNDNKDIFIAKISSSGEWQWAKQAGGEYYDSAKKMEFDNQNNLVLIGEFKNNSTIGETSITSSGLSDVFVAKISSSGEWQWAKQAGGTLSDNVAFINNDNSGNAFIVGQFCGGAEFGDTTLTSNDIYPAIFIAKISSSGEWQWAKQAGGTLTNTPGSITTNSNGDIFIAGQFSGDNSTFGETTLPGYPTIFVDTPPNYGSGWPGGLRPQPNPNIFVAKISSSGEWQWAKQAGGSLSDGVTDLFIQNNKLNIIGLTNSNPSYFNDGNFLTSGGFIWKVNPSDGSN